MRVLKDEERGLTEFMLSYEWSSFQDYHAKYGLTTDVDAWDEQLRHVITYEGLGILVNKNMVNARKLNRIIRTRESFKISARGSGSPSPL